MSKGVPGREVRLLYRIERSARTVAGGKRGHRHPNGTTSFDQHCGTCRLLSAIDDLDAYRELKKRIEEEEHGMGNH